MKSKQAPEVGAPLNAALNILLDWQEVYISGDMAIGIAPGKKHHEAAFSFCESEEHCFHLQAQLSHRGFRWSHFSRNDDGVATIIYTMWISPLWEVRGEASAESTLKATSESIRHAFARAAWSALTAEKEEKEIPSQLPLPKGRGLRQTQ